MPIARPAAEIEPVSSISSRSRIFPGPKAASSVNPSRSYKKGDETWKETDRLPADIASALYFLSIHVARRRLQIRLSNSAPDAQASQCNDLIRVQAFNAVGVNRFQRRCRVIGGLQQDRHSRSGDTKGTQTKKNNGQQGPSTHAFILTEKRASFSRARRSTRPSRISRDFSAGRRRTLA